MAEESGKKQVKYRGKTIDELRSISVREFSRYLKSRQRRFVLRKFQEIEKFIERAKNKIEKNKPIKTHRRDLVVVPGMVGMKVGIYNGKTFVTVQFTEEMLGHKFGEFAPSRARIKHGKAGVGATKGTRAKSKK